MRIGFFVYEYPPAIVGGLGTYAQYITREFVRLGHDVVVFTMHREGLKTSEVAGGVEVHRPIGVDATSVFPLLVTEELRYWGHFFNDIFIYNILSSAKFINQYLNQERMHVDVVAVHDWLSAIAGLTIRTSTSIPVVFHVHSTEWGRLPGGGSNVVSKLESEMGLQANRVITVSQAMRDDLIGHSWQAPKISAIWNGVDPWTYNPDRVPRSAVHAVRERYGIADDETMLFFVGRLTPIKGVRNLVQAMPEVLARFPKTKLVILGLGEEQVDICELAARLNISDSIICRFDFVPEHERIAHFAAADICVFPSTYEPFGIVSLEAMAMEKPVVVGARGVVGFREQVVPVGPDQSGLHVNAHDPADIAWGIKELLANPERARAMGKRGRERVLKYFTWEQVAQQTLRVYQQVAQAAHVTATL